MEKVIQKRSLREFSSRNRGWSERSYTERLDAMALICTTRSKDGKVERRLSGIHPAAKK